MIAKLTGKPEILDNQSIILDVNNVGYKIFFNPKPNQPLPSTLFIHTHVKDDALDLYGFIAKDELQLFKLLISVSGIGPKTGINVMDKGVEAITQAVSKGDVDFFTTVPRLGRKNAQKIIIELKSKLGGLKDLDLTSDTSETKDAITALISLGFSRSEAREALNQVFDQPTLEAKISQAIKLLGKK
ncbi:Holliday junction DNA helicase RuvA [Candidatus Beckwithbacteria bacterium CG2_30_44_31]|uniref:Holliday junction branch migration complex subunit RuvA n=1 Tax=Candidatus Beckwithbacteria bacterium CG2_30_44_31 TaxID=1805035 RepID=A0A1J5BBP2_9BACT|nr:MAG: Holliday junction DNA helicase RuvA [Candidatus Beckwithbacteria bacterium CG2_30_44_31]